ncbi:MAG TPA: glycosyltransferase family 1 protein [Arcobacter sp.]|nr:glycosyltransferase family 1 protein [Arcobacter sp.]
MKNIFLISNMYPSGYDKFYGIFVKNFVDNFTDTKIKVSSKSAIKGRGKTKLEKILKYLKLYISIIYNFFYSKFDVIYIHYPPFVSFVLLFCLIFKKKKVVLNFHGTDLLGKSKILKYLDFFTIKLIKKSSLIVVPSNFFKLKIIEKYKIPNKKIFVSPSGGIDSKVFDKISFAKNTSYFKLGFVGRIDEGKGWEVLIEAVSKLKKDIPNILLYIAGAGKQLENMKQCIQENNLESNIIYEGSIEHKKLPLFYNKIDVFIFPTYLEESLGLVGIESLSCGIPIIASKVGGIQDYLINEKNGLFFELKNSDDLKEKILMMYRNKELFSFLKSNAQSSVEKYDKKQVTSDITNILEKVINEKI